MSPRNVGRGSRGVVRTLGVFEVARSHGGDFDRRTPVARNLLALIATLALAAGFVAMVLAAMGGA